MPYILFNIQYPCSETDFKFLVLQMNKLGFRDMARSYY